MRATRAANAQSQSEIARRAGARLAAAGGAARFSPTSSKTDRFAMGPPLGADLGRAGALGNSAARRVREAGPSHTCEGGQDIDIKRL